MDSSAFFKRDEVNSQPLSSSVAPVLVGPGLFDDALDASVAAIQLLDLLLELLNIISAVLEIDLQALLRHNTSLLFQLRELLGIRLTHALLLAKLGLDFCELVGQLSQLIHLEVILLANVLVLFAGVRQFYDSVSDLLSEFVQLFVTFFDLLIQGLILDLQLLEINQVKAISKLLLLLVLFVQVFVSITQRDVLETVLVDFLVLETFMDLPLFDHGLLKFLASP